MLDIDKLYYIKNYNTIDNYTTHIHSYIIFAIILAINYTCITRHFFKLLFVIQRSCQNNDI